MTNPFRPVDAVVGRDDQLVRYRGHLVLEDEEALGPRADDRDELVAGPLQGLRDRIDRRDADAAADADDGAEVLDLALASQRPDHVEDALTESVGRHLLRRGADRLEDDRDEARLPVEVGDRQRDPLRVVVGAEDDELSRRHGVRDVGAIELPELDVGGEVARFDDLVPRPGRALGGFGCHVVSPGWLVVWARG